MKRLLALLVLFTLAACAQAPEPGADALPGLSPLTFGTPAYDRASGLAKHSAGVYVVGYTDGNLHGMNKGDADVFIRKYRANGTVPWAKQFGTSNFDFVTGVASDGSNNAYVAGTTGGNLAGFRGVYDGFLRKYRASGTVSWTRQFGTSSGDQVAGVATFGSNAVYVAGITTGNFAGSLGRQDAFIRKYTASGRVAWTRQFGTSDEDSVSDVAVDGRGNAYVVGVTLGSFPEFTNGGNGDMFIRRYNANGTVAWTKQIAVNTDDSFGGAVAVCGSNVYLVGSFTDSNFADYDVRMVKFTTAGTQLWSLVYGTARDELVFDIIADGSGVTFAGETDGPFAGNHQGNGDGFVYKVNGSGTRRWAVQHGTSEDDTTRAIVSRGGQLYAAGSTDGSLSGSNNVDTDAFLMRLSGTDGSTVWTD